jgi:hypothetical protein
VADSSRRGEGSASTCAKSLAACSGQRGALGQQARASRPPVGRAGGRLQRRQLSSCAGPVPLAPRGPPVHSLPSRHQVREPTRRRTGRCPAGRTLMSTRKEAAAASFTRGCHSCATHSWQLLASSRAGLPSSGHSCAAAWGAGSRAVQGGRHRASAASVAGRVWGWVGGGGFPERTSSSLAFSQSMHASSAAGA